ncbi:4,5:9,10-diseco-3-hydroxy-5,9,17-trioxoandrosta-1(10),2-diene-4-oate hydrolase [compost metagenome]
MTQYQSIWKHLFRTPHQLAWIDVKGVRTRYLEAGSQDSPAVILLHGATGSLEYFCANIAALAKHFRVIAVDMIGNGLSEAPDYPYTPSVYRTHVRDFMDAMNIGKASLIGVALGSAIAIHLAYHFPDRVEKVVMVSPGAIMVNESDVSQFISGVKERRGAATENLSWENVENIVKALFYNPEKSLMADLVSTRLECYQGDDLERRMANMMSSAQPEQFLSHDQWRTLQTPLLVVAATSIKHMFVENARKIAELAPNAQLIEISECRIWAHYEQAELFNAAAIEFLRA